MIGWAIEGLVASAALMALVLAIRSPVRRAFGADVAYALWALPVLRLALPPLPQAIRHAAIAPVAQIGEPVVVLLAAPAGGAVRVAAPAFDWSVVVPVLAALWLLGALAFAGFHVLAHRRFCRDLLAGAEAVEARGGVEVIETPAARGPLAFGIWRRYVAFPADFNERYDDAERDLALAHELGHHARGDLIANWIALAVLALHWFNPIAWYAFRAFRTDQEVANDARVLAGRPAMTRHTYACAILKAAHGGAVSAACHLHTIDDLKGRLRMLTTRRISRVRLAGGAATVAMVGVAALGLTASGTQAAEHVRTKVETATGIDLAKFDGDGHFAPFVPFTEFTAFKPVSPLTRLPERTSAIRVPDQDVADAPAAPDFAMEPPRPPVAPITPVSPIAPVAPVPPAIDHEALVTGSHTEATDGMVTRRHYVRIARNGDAVIEDRVANLPRVISTICAGAERPLVIHEQHDGKRSITICTDRIQTANARAERIAANSVTVERNAYRSALAGLRSARANITANDHMAEDDRREALQAIDQSLVEIRADMARVD